MTKVKSVVFLLVRFYRIGSGIVFELFLFGRIKVNILSIKMSGGILSFLLGPVFFPRKFLKSDNDGWNLAYRRLSEA